MQKYGRIIGIRGQVGRKNEKGQCEMKKKQVGGETLVVKHFYSENDFFEEETTVR
jgi:hypothetical protein